MKQFWDYQICKFYQIRLVFIIVFETHCDFFIVLPIRLKTCRSNDFSCLRVEICAPEKLGLFQRFRTPERAGEASGAQFVQAVRTNLINLFVDEVPLSLIFFAYVYFKLFLLHFKFNNIHINKILQTLHKPF